MAYHVLEIHEAPLSRIIATVPTMGDAKVAAFDAIAAKFGSRPFQTIGEPDIAHDGFDVLAFIPGTCEAIQIAINRLP